MAGSGDNATTPMAAVTRCAAQAGQSGFVTSGGAVLMCGVQMWGRLGTPIWAPSNMPAPVVGLDGSDGAPIVVDLALGNRFVRSCCWRVHSFGTRLWVATICGHATPPSDCQNRHYHRRHLSFLFLFFSKYIPLSPAAQPFGGGHGRGCGLGVGVERVRQVWSRAARVRHRGPAPGAAHNAGRPCRHRDGLRKYVLHWSRRAAGVLGRVV